MSDDSKALRDDNIETRRREAQDMLVVLAKTMRRGNLTYLDEKVLLAAAIELVEYSKP